MTRLTPRELAFAVAFRDYRHVHGVSPTLAEWGALMGVTTTTAHCHLEALIRKRVLRRTAPGVARSPELRDASMLPPRRRMTVLKCEGEVW